VEEKKGTKIQRDGTQRDDDGRPTQNKVGGTEKNFGGESLTPGARIGERKRRIRKGVKKQTVHQKEKRKRGAS